MIDKCLHKIRVNNLFSEGEEIKSLDQYCLYECSGYDSGCPCNTSQRHLDNCIWDEGKNSYIVMLKNQKEVKL